MNYAKHTVPSFNVDSRIVSRLHGDAQPMVAEEFFYKLVCDVLHLKGNAASQGKKPKYLIMTEPLYRDYKIAADVYCKTINLSNVLFDFTALYGEPRELLGLQIMVVDSDAYGLDIGY